MKILVAIFVLVGLSQCEVFDRPCRPFEDIVVKSNFQPAAYIGLWYETERYEQWFGTGFDCIQAQYTFNADGSVNVVNSGFDIDNQAFIRETGRAVVSFPDEVPLRAMLNVTFFPSEPDIANYWILSTDYSSYSFVISCLDLPNQQSKESYWLLSRLPTITPTVRARADQLIDLYIDRSRIRPTVQNDTVCQRL